MEGISRRTVLGAATVTAAAATLLTAAGTAQAADTVGDKSTTKSPHATTKGTEAPMAVTTEPQKYEAFVLDDEGDMPAQATFDIHADAGDMWAYIDSALARLRQQDPQFVYTGYVRRYDQVITDIAHP